MARIKNQQESDSVVNNNNLVPQSGEEVAKHSNASTINRAAEDGQHEGTDLPRRLTDEQLREVATNPHVLAAMKRIF